MLTGKQKNYLRGLAHPLNPVVMVGGKGVTPNVLEEVNQALEAHELIKIKLPGEDREVRQSISEEIQRASESQVVQSIGRVLVLYRASEDKKINLPN